MRRLRDFQRVDTYVGDSNLPAQVISVTGDEARLQLIGPLPDEVTLPHRCQLAFDHNRQLVMLSGILWPVGDRTVRFVVGDGVRAADKRQHARLSLPLPARVTPVDAAGKDCGATIHCRTQDISAGGCLLGIGGMPSRIRVAIELPGSLGVIEVQASVVRSTDEVTACAFIALSDERRATIERFVETVRTELAKRFAAKAAA